MPDLQMTLTGEEREFLATLLESILKETRVEEHRTKTLLYREHILHKEELLAALMAKLGKSDQAGQ